MGLLRSVAFFTPAGLGVQDLGYATALGGAPDAVLAFTLLKRCKELFWVAVGYGLLALRRSRPARLPVADPTGAA